MSFPLDDVTLLAIKESLKARISFTGPDGEELTAENPRLVGGEYRLPDLIEFLNGGPDAEVGYGERDLVAALVDEVLMLRHQLELAQTRM